MQLMLDDSRRLTGPNIFSDLPGAVMDVIFSNVNHDTVVTTWQRHVQSYLDALHWHDESIYYRIFANADGTLGASLMLTAPIDVLYSATDINEAAWATVCAELLGTSPPDFTQQLQHLNQLIATESKPALLQLQAAARQQHSPFLSDDDELSVGYGASAQTWAVDAIPSVESIHWDTITNIPLALITGTNGKSTSVRLTASVLQADNKIAGTTSTDFIKVGDRILDHGDYSGPGGARALLRHPDVDIAILEVARGGILRRGLGVEQANVALITNVAADHLGQYGINTVADLIETKFVVQRALNKNGTLVLNADDNGVVAYAKQAQLQQQCTLYWFSESSDNAMIQNELAHAGHAVFVKHNQLILFSEGQWIEVAHLNDIPITLQAAARHNVQNCLGVTGLCHALGINPEHIATGLTSFSSDPGANPGRSNLFEFNDCKVLIDFAHNEHGYTAMAKTMNNLPAKRRLIMLAQAGDRSDEAIRAMTAIACSTRPDKIIICKLTDYLRGRPDGEIEIIMKNEILHHGLTTDIIQQVPNTLDGVNYALEWAQPGDLLFLQVLTDRERIFERMNHL